MLNILCSETSDIYVIRQKALCHTERKYLVCPDGGGAGRGFLHAHQEVQEQQLCAFPGRCNELLTPRALVKEPVLPNLAHLAFLTVRI